MGGKRTAGRMRQASAIALLAVLLAPTSVRVGNTDEVNDGIDVTLSGGAVVASTYTGAALWYNPAGIARIKKASPLSSLSPSGSCEAPNFAVLNVMSRRARTWKGVWSYYAPALDPLESHRGRECALR